MEQTAKKATARRPRKKRRGRPPAKKNQRQSGKPLPPALEPSSQAEPAKQEPQRSGLFGLGNLFQNRESDRVESPMPSATSSTSPGSEPLSSESLRIIEAVPDTAGDGAGTEDADEGLAPGVYPGPDPRYAFVSTEAAEILCRMPYDAAAKWTKRKSWALTDEEAVKLGELAAPVANSLLARYLPALFLKWGEDNPELVAFVIGVTTITAAKFGAVREEARSEPAKIVQEKPAARVPGPQANGDGVVWAGKGAKP